MNALVQMSDFGVTTGSRTVAEVFEKEHQNVLRSIDGLIEKRPDLVPGSFRQIAEILPMPRGGGSREVRAYEMDRKGFTLLAMGFTGEKALDWKIRYIDAFDAMEAALTPEPEPVVQALAHQLDAGDLAPRLAVIREARHLFGRSAARALWGQIGLPRIDEHPVAALLPGRMADSVRDWVAARTVPQDGARTGSTPLYNDYLAFCEDLTISKEAQTSFGRMLERLGYPSVKGRDGLMYRCGLKLKD